MRVVGGNLSYFNANARIMIVASQDVAEVYNQVTSNYNTLISAGAESPSQYVMAGVGGLCALNPHYRR